MIRYRYSQLSQPPRSASVFSLLVTAWVFGASCTTYDDIAGLEQKAKSRRQTTSPVLAAQADASPSDAGVMQERKPQLDSSAGNGKDEKREPESETDASPSRPAKAVGDGGINTPSQPLVDAGEQEDTTPDKPAPGTSVMDMPETSCDPELCMDASATPQTEETGLALGSACSRDRQCTSGDCSDNTCTAAAAGSACSEFTDCLSGICRRGVCVEDPEVALCDGGICPAPTTMATCAAGTYVTITDGTTIICGPCASGTFSTEDNAASCIAWQDCAPGQYVATQGTNRSDRTCQPCAAGEDSQIINAGSCLSPGACAAGTVRVAGAEAGAECAACSAGVYCAGGDAVQQACPIGTWDDDADPATPCVPQTTCSAGQHITSRGTASTDRLCGVCLDGTFSATENAESCTPWKDCGPGAFVRTAGSSAVNRVCSECTSGTFSRIANAPECTAWKACPAGSYVEIAGSDTSDQVCTSCAIGSFTEDANQPLCEEFTVCRSPAEYMVSDGTDVEDRTCELCASPLVTTADNQTECISDRTRTFQMSDGEVVLEVEHYNEVWDDGEPDNDSWLVQSDVSAGGGEYMYLGPDDGDLYESSVATTSPRLSYLVNFTEIGIFFVHVRARLPADHGNSDSLFAGLDASNNPAYYSFQDAGLDWTWKSKTVIVSTTGEHTFRLFGREDGIQLDRVVISASELSPLGEGPAESPRQ